MIIESVQCKDCHYRYRDYLGQDKCCSRELIRQHAEHTGRESDLMSCVKIHYFKHECKEYIQASLERQTQMNHR